jgi:hypothetical protein
MDYKNKYFKYKNKYIELKQKIGGVKKVELIDIFKKTPHYDDPDRALYDIKIDDVSYPLYRNIYDYSSNYNKFDKYRCDLIKKNCDKINDNKDFVPELFNSNMITAVKKKIKKGIYLWDEEFNFKNMLYNFELYQKPNYKFKKYLAEGEFKISILYEDITQNNLLKVISLNFKEDDISNTIKGIKIIKNLRNRTDIPDEICKSIVDYNIHKISLDKFNYHYFESDYKGIPIFSLFKKLNNKIYENLKSKNNLNLSDFNKFILFLKKIYEILIYFYQINFTHGDFHLGNILYDENDDIYIIDFDRSSFEKSTDDFRRFYDIFFSLIHDSNIFIEIIKRVYKKIILQPIYKNLNKEHKEYIDDDYERMIRLIDRGDNQYYKFISIYLNTIDNDLKLKPIIDLYGIKNSNYYRSIDSNINKKNIESFMKMPSLEFICVFYLLGYENIDSGFENFLNNEDIIKRNKIYLYDMLYLATINDDISKKIYFNYFKNIIDDKNKFFKHLDQIK